MKTKMQYTALIASLMLVMPYVAYADQGSISQYASQRLQIQMASMTCYNAYFTGYFNDVVTVINNATVTSSLSNDMTKLGTNFSALQADANAGNKTQFKTDVKTYDSNVRTANLDARTAIKNTHDKNVYSTLKSDMVQLKAVHKSCTSGVKQEQKAKLREQMFNKDLLHEQKITNKLAAHGANTTELNQTINLASNQIQAFETAVNNAQNSTQLEAALHSFCLYNGCKNPDNFHLAAKIAIESNQAQLNFLATKNSTSSYQVIVNQAQTDLNNAQTALDQVGSNKYQGTQSSDVWTSIKAATDLIHHLQQIVNHKH